MSLCRSALLLSVVIVSCAVLLPKTYGLVRITDAREKNDNGDLVNLLKKLRERLQNEEVAQPSRSVHHDVNKGRWHDVGSKSSRSANGLTDDQVTQLVGAINNKRRAEGASNMNHVRWSAEIAKLAQVWSNDCVFHLGTKPFNTDTVGVLTLGTNVWAFDGSFDANNIVNNWYNDKATFNPKKDQCGYNQPCGANKHLVNAETTVVGCGLAFCPSVAGQSNLNFVVCYFGPAGNYEDVGPFTPGPACTMCKSGKFYCNNGLCDDSCTSAGSNCECKADCKNCGTKTSDCTCQCKPGSTGVNCADECKNYNEKCHREVNGWWPEMCTSAFNYVRYECPLMCGLCKPGDPCGRNEEVDEYGFIR